jgi:hypothetical protein
MKKKDLKLNTLSRYTKESPRLVLEEHSHCEVPAGCGGVVLRCRNPQTGVPLTVSFYSAGEAALYLDAVELANAKVLVPWGTHVFAVTVSDFDHNYAILGLAAGTDAMLDNRAGPAGGPPVTVSSMPGSNWKYTAEEPSGDWMQPGFDESGWQPLVANSHSSEEAKSMASYRIERITEKGGRLLGIARPASKIWVRGKFNIEKPEA